MLREEQKRRSHDAILASAIRLLLERGIAAAGVSDVMAGAGLTVGGFYSHFANKEALIRNALQENATRVRARIVRTLHERPGSDGLTALVYQYLSRKHRDDVAGGCALPSAIPSVSFGADTYRTDIAEVLSSLRELLAGALGNGKQARRHALGLLALMYGGLSIARALRGTALSDEVLTACRQFATDSLACFEQKNGTSSSVERVTAQLEGRKR